ncbi:hypothetical protein NRY95_14805 [Xanthomonas campestris pv. phormiicola]|nr:hypothetical protein [Xanthomonas campestris pv. phormiicola]UYC14994.1 hypothetical protein NRY95_14805 [Xanthomonas campestris pv. phormiicola]
MEVGVRDGLVWHRQGAKSRACRQEDWQRRQSSDVQGQVALRAVSRQCLFQDSGGFARILMRDFFAELVLRALRA